MWIAIVLSMLVGLAIVVQNGANAHLMKSANLWLLLAVANLLTAVLAGTVFLAQRSRGEIVAEVSRIPASVLVPGFCGIVITAGMPMAISKMGVFNTILLVIACQILAGLAWDRYFAGQAVSPAQLAGAALVFAGVWLVLKPTG